MATNKEEKKAARHREWAEQIAECQSSGMKMIYKEQAEVVKLIFELYSFDQSLAKISRHLELYRIPSPSNKPLWGRQIINNFLSNANYLGNYDYPRIINEELWNAVQNKKNNNCYSMRYGQSKSAV